MTELQLEELQEELTNFLHEALERILLCVEKAERYPQELEVNAKKASEGLVWLQKNGKLFFYYRDISQHSYNYISSWEDACRRASIDELYRWSEFVHHGITYSTWPPVGPRCAFHQLDGKLYLYVDLPGVIKDIYIYPKQTQIARRRLWAGIDNQGKLVYTEAPTEIPPSLEVVLLLQKGGDHP